MLKEQKKVIPLLRTAISTIIGNKVIIFPFCIIIFVQLLLLEVIYFSPRYPLNIFFGPLVKQFWSEKYLHYPYNFLVLPRIYQNSYIQAFVYILISSFFIACSILIIASINKGSKVKFRNILKDVIPYYFHIIVIASISVAAIKLLFILSGNITQRALLIRSTTGIFYLIKRTVLLGSPYLNLLFSVFVTTLFAYVLPIIVIEKKNIFKAIFLNFKTLWGSFWFTFSVILLPVMFLIPVLLLRSSLANNGFYPELTLYILILSAVVMVGIDVVVYTAVTIYYLLLKEE